MRRILPHLPPQIKHSRKKAFLQYFFLAITPEICLNLRQ
jgi:hypothetical protein